MGGIRIITDSTADIPQAVREQHGIEMVPLKVHFGAETYLDSITMQSDEFYSMLASSPVLPTTSQPSPVDFLDVYKKCAEEEGAQLLSIHISSALSGTYQSAVLAKSMLEDKTNIAIVDSRTASYGLGMLAVAAARAAGEGRSLEELVRLVEDMRKQTRIYFLVDTLEYLQKGGRIGKASAVLGSLLNIKPILTVDGEGEVAPVDKVRGQKKAMARMIEMLKAEFGDRQVQVSVEHSVTRQTAEELAGQLRDHFNVKQLDFTEIGPVIGTHVGPGALAVIMCPA